MNYEKIEQMLSDAKEQLPTTEMEWKVSDAMEDKNGNKKTAFKKTGMHISRTMVATFAIIFIMVVGGGTVLASIGLKYTDNFGQWSQLQSVSWIDCEIELEKRNGQLPKAFGEYKFNSCSTTLVAPKGTSQIEAMIKNVYTPMHMEYVNEVSDSKIFISMGSTDEDYWHFYYEYEKQENSWVPVDYDMYFEYRGIMVYAILEPESEDVRWTWVDEDNQNCWVVYIPFNDDVDGQEMIKEIIALNTSAWSDQTVYVHEQAELFEGFLLGDYKTEDEVHPVIYNEEMYVIIYEDHLDITINDTLEQFTVDIPDYIAYSIYNSRVSNVMYDVNQDGVKEIVFCTSESGTLNVSYVDAVDLVNKCLIPVDYNVQELVDAFKELDVKDKDSYAFDTCCQDEQTFLEDGTIQVMTLFGIQQEGIHAPEFVGTVVGTLVYDIEQNVYVLDENSIHIEWFE